MLSATTKNRIARVAAPVVTAVALPVFIIAEILNYLLNIRRTSVFDARGKTVVITGASSGIGEALAYQYALLGAKLVLCARREKQLADVAAKCRDLGAEEPVCEVVDVTNEAEWKAVVQRTGNTLGIDLIILNAGISMGEFANQFTDVATFDAIMKINYLAFVSGILHSLPFLKKSRNPKNRGKVVGISSILGIAGGPTRTGYCASKFAMKGFMDAIRIEEPGLDFVMIYPGAVKTEINDTRIGNVGHLDLDARGLMTAREAAEIIVDTVRRGGIAAARDEVFSLQGKLLWFIKDWFPLTRDLIFNLQFRKMMKKEVGKKKE
ncbi:hypothetical protein HDU78_009019 [Chytriomyces hyalinus]|nr:hypothetical protein HDU78_009019 [Chytriomyces hyalinus]